MDSDILSTLIFTFLLLVVVAISSKYKMNIRQWFGAIFTIMALSGIIVAFSNYNLSGIIPAIIWLIIGSLLWFVKPKKTNEKKEVHKQK